MIYDVTFEYFMRIGMRKVWPRKWVESTMPVIAKNIWFQTHFGMLFLNWPNWNIFWNVIFQRSRGYLNWRLLHSCKQTIKSTFFVSKTNVTSFLVILNNKTFPIKPLHNNCNLILQCFIKPKAKLHGLKHFLW